MDKNIQLCLLYSLATLEITNSLTAPGDCTEYDEQSSTIYCYISTPETFANARSSCNGLTPGNWHLVKIDDSTENSYVDPKSWPSGSIIDIPYWIGVEVVDDSDKWIADGTSVSFEYYKNNQNGPYSYFNTNNGWHRTSSTSETHPYMCEYFGGDPVGGNPEIPSPTPVEDKVSTTVELIPPTTAVETVPSTSTAEVLPSTATAEIIPSTTTDETIPSTTTAEIIPSTTTDKTIPSTTTAEIEPSTTTAETIPSTTTAEIVSSTTAAETIPSTITAKTLPPTTTAEIVQSTTTADILQTTTTAEVITSTETAHSDIDTTKDEHISSTITISYTDDFTSSDITQHVTYIQNNVDTTTNVDEATSEMGTAIVNTNSDTISSTGNIMSTTQYDQTVTDNIELSSTQDSFTGETTDALYSTLASSPTSTEGGPDVPSQNTQFTTNQHTTTTDSLAQLTINLPVITLDNVIQPATISSQGSTINQGTTAVNDVTQSRINSFDQSTTNQVTATANSDIQYTTQSVEQTTVYYATTTIHDDVQSITDQSTEGQHTTDTLSTSVHSTSQSVIQSTEPDIPQEAIEHVDVPDGVPCPGVPVVANSLIHYEETTSGIYVTYYCIHAHHFPDRSTSVTIECQLADGTWSNNPPDCQIRRCPAVREIDHGTPDSQDNSYEAIVTYTCDIGSTFADGSTVRTIICLYEERWSAEIKDCKVTHCDSLGIDATVIETEQTNEDSSETNIFHLSILVSNSKIVQSCTDNVLFDGSPAKTSECSSQGYWSDIVEPCAARCSSAPMLENANINSRQTTNGTIVTYSCHPGYRFPTGHQTYTIECLEDYTWSGRPPECSLVTCPPVQYVNHTTASTDLAVYGTQVTYTCDSGYIQLDNTTQVTVTCSDTGLWTSAVQPCMELVCGTPPIIENAILLISQNMSTGAWITYSCKDTYRFIDGLSVKNMTCVVSGEWVGIDSYCTNDRCPPSHSHPHVHKSTTGTNKGTTVTYTPNVGYQFIDGATHHSSTCLDNLEWENIDISTTVITCPTLPMVPHSILSENKTTYNTVVTYLCHDGHENMDGYTNKTLACLDTGQWNMAFDQLGCYPITCENPTRVPNASTTATKAIYREDITYKCRAGHWINRNIAIDGTLKCLADRTWSNATFQCKEVHCTSIPIWDNLIANTTQTRYRTVAKITCADGYNFTETNQDYFKVQCGARGLWEPNLPFCEDMSESSPIQAETTEANNSESIGATIAAVIFAFICFVVIVDLLFMWNEKHIIIQNYKDGWLNIQDVFVKLQTIPNEGLNRWRLRNRNTNGEFVRLSDVANRSMPDTSDKNKNNGHYMKAVAKQPTVVSLSKQPPVVSLSKETPIVSIPKQPTVVSISKRTPTAFIPKQPSVVHIPKQQPIIAISREPPFVPPSREPQISREPPIVRISKPGPSDPTK